METLQWDERGYTVNGERQFLISGEFHYFRVPYEEWEKRLLLLKEAGGTCVATYIPWMLHEPEEGHFLFGDIGYRGLEDFLTLCGKIGLYVIGRPGPYQYSELRNGGLPDWLLENYPEILAQDIHGKPMNQTSVSYLHPRFLEKTEKWLDAVCPILARHTIQRGGPVIFVQLDNELMSIHLASGQCDYNAEAMGIGRANGYYVRYLTEKYKTIARLNAFYETNYAAFTEVQPILHSEAKTLAQLHAATDYWNFYFWACSEYLLRLKGYMRKNGIECDVQHNAGGPDINPCFKTIADRLGKDFLFGSDTYYNLDMHWAQNNPTPQYALKAFHSAETLRLMGYPPTLFELASGSLSDWPPITPQDALCCYKTNVALGFKGMNYYIFTGGRNPENIGATGDVYDYNAPVGHNGEIRPLYHCQKELHGLLAENRWISRAMRESDLQLGFIWEYPQSDWYLKSNEHFALSGSEAWKFTLDGFLATSFCLSFSPEYADLSRTDFTENPTKPLVAASASFMPAEVQRNLVRFLQNGGRLLIGPLLPSYDENYKPCTILKDFLGGTGYRKLDIRAFRLNVGPVNNVYVNDRLFVCETVPEGAELLAVEQNSGAAAGWKKTVDGGGEVVWLGLKWHCAKNEHFAMLRYLLEQLSVQPPEILCDNPNVWTSLYNSPDGDGRQALFLMNLFSSPMEAAVQLKDVHGRYRDVGRHHLQPMEVKLLILK